MNKEKNPKRMSKEDREILKLIERKKDETEALRKILEAFDKDKAREKDTSITPKQK